MPDQTPTVQLTPKTRAVLDALRALIRERGYAPSVRELAARAGLSSQSTVVHHLQILQDRGLIAREPGQARTLRILDDAMATPRQEDTNHG